LKRTKIAINFHTGTADYPGIGCTNFALYNQEKKYGVVCHYMNPGVDSGDIIYQDIFRIYENDTVETLTVRCYAHLISLFYDVCDDIIQGRELPDIGIKWNRKPYTRKELNELCRCTSNMSKSEIKRRIRATNFNNWPTYLKMDDMIFKYVEKI